MTETKETTMRSESEQFVSDAIRTESRIDAVRFDRDRLSILMGVVLTVGAMVDDMKKNVFYGKPIDKERTATMLDHSIRSLTFLHTTVNAEERIEALDVDPRIFHGIIGMFTEAVELVEALGCTMFEDEPLDAVNIGEELGDSDWYKAILLSTLGMSESVIRAKVIAKLKKRYPHKFDSNAAINRDVVAERKILES